MPRFPTVRRHGRRLVLVGAVLLNAGTAAAAVPGGARKSPPDFPTDLASPLAEWWSGRGGVVVLDTLLDQRIARLRNDAPSFDRAWREILDSGSPVVIGTREQLESIMPSNVRGSRAWAAITVNWDGNGGHLQRSAVAIRVDWLREIHERYHTPDGAFIEAVDELLIHEIYGHLVPIVIAGTSRASCPDPAPGDRLENSCVGRRELALRAERAEFVAAREPARR